MKTPLESFFLPLPAGHDGTGKEVGFLDRNRKEELVKDMYQKLQESQAVFLFNYHGMNVINVENLRKNLREAKGEMKVAKNTLAKIAFQQAQYPLEENLLTGQSAFAFSYEDAVAVAKTLSEFTKKAPQMELRGGWLRRSFLGVDEVKRLSILPSREVLIAQVVGGVAAPLTGLVGVLSGVLRQCVWVLKAIEDKKRESE
ncbi:MAG TPA: 50S ribosomal protein L10 [Atribacteraceae bacterium]|nr:50S ribosomal protein L10 [Atribacteraceae bacterium]